MKINFKPSNTDGLFLTKVFITMVIYHLVKKIQENFFFRVCYQLKMLIIIKVINILFFGATYGYYNFLLNLIAIFLCFLNWQDDVVSTTGCKQDIYQQKFL